MLTKLSSWSFLGQICKWIQSRQLCKTIPKLQNKSSRPLYRNLIFKKSTLMIESDYCTSRAIKFYVCANITSRWSIRNCLSYYTPQWFFKPINDSNSMNQSIPTDQINQIMGNNDLLVYVMAPHSLTLKSWKVGTRVSASNNQISYFYTAMPSNHCF